MIWQKNRSVPVSFQHGPEAKFYQVARVCDRNWEEQDQLGLTWEQIDALDWDWYLWGYGSAGHLEITAVSLSPNPVDCGATFQVSVTVEMVLT